jgi:hypothetical protein
MHATIYGVLAPPLLLLLKENGSNRVSRSSTILTGLQAKDETMKRYLIERDIPGVGNLSAELLKGVAAKSNGVLARLAPKIQWLESFVAANKTFCVYLAESEALVFEHAKLGGFSVTKVTEVPTVISPMTAY